MVATDFALLQLQNPNGIKTGDMPEMVHILRKYLDMDIAFVTEFNDNIREIKLVDTDEPDCPVQVGQCTPLEETYCKLILEGKLPYVMRNIEQYPGATALPITKALNIQSYISAPIPLVNGKTFGTLCCYSHAPDTSLNDRDLRMMQACAEMTGRQIDRWRQQAQQREEAEARIRSVLSSDRMTTLYQPIYDIQQDRVIGFEALSRFPDFPQTRPDKVFNEAHDIGLGCELEALAIRRALHALQDLPPDVYIGVNISPKTILCQAFNKLFKQFPPDRVTLEVTEHVVVEHYQLVKTALAPLRERGMKLAVDDAGAGFSSFRHILELAPDCVKLDMSLITNVNIDPARRALLAAFAQFARDTHADLVAEGIESKAELQALTELGIGKIQGYYYGRPMPLQQAMTVGQRWASMRS